MPRFKVPYNDKTLMAWAERRFGKSKAKRIRWRKLKNANWYGTWDWNGTIELNLAMIRSRSTLYRTMAHEWKHAQQTWREYKKLSKIYSYKNHPLEKEARMAERLSQVANNSKKVKPEFF